MSTPEGERESASQRGGWATSISELRREAAAKARDELFRLSS
jgi:hypothetical protein